MRRKHQVQPLVAISVVAALVVGAVAIWVVSRNDDPARSSTPAAAPAAAAAADTTSAAASAGARPAVRRPTPAERRRVEALVAQRQERDGAESRRFMAAGWKLVETAPPDEAVQRLDPRLLLIREDDLRLQLDTTPLRGDQIANAKTIALRAPSRRTREAALRALGRARSDTAQHALTELFDELTDDVDRSLLVGYLRPTRLDDARGRWLLEQLDAPGVSPQLKKQITFSLVLTWFRESGGRPERLATLLDRVPGSWRAETRATWRTLARR